MVDEPCSPCGVIYPCSTDSDNCTQRLPTVKLDPTTKLGASCALAGKPTLGDEYYCFSAPGYSRSE